MTHCFWDSSLSSLLLLVVSSTLPVFSNLHVVLGPPSVANIAGNGLYIFPEIGGNDFMYAYVTLGASPAEVITNDVPAAISAIKTNMEVGHNSPLIRPNSLNKYVLRPAASEYDAVIQT